jgi:hypothetical protein
MEFNFSLRRLAILIACVGLFWLLGGFGLPGVAEAGYHSPQRVTRAWFYCILMFLGGAVSVSVVDHHIGNLDRSSLRFLYVILGVLLMGGSYLWLRTLREAVA